MLLHRYTNIEYILNLDLEEGIEFINKAYEKQLDEQIWQRWLVEYRNMDENNFISFENYKALLTKKVDKTIKTTEILKQSEEIIKKAKKGGTIGVRNI